MNTAANTAAANTATKRVRRSPEEVRAERLAREARLAQKAAERKARLQAQVAKAEAAAKRAMERQAQIESNVPVGRTAREPLPTIKEPTIKRVQRELQTFVKELGQTHGLNFETISPRVTRQGSGLSFHLTGVVGGAVSTVRRAVGATREAARFMEFHKLVGIKASVLNKEVELAGEEGKFKVLGLKGRAHDVVLQKVGTNDAPRTIPVDEFRTKMVTG